MAGVREKKKQKTRQEILQCAETLFSDKGFHETTMEEIAEAAFVGVGTLYNYYGSKGELLVASMTRLTEAILADAAPVVVSRHTDAAAAVATLLLSYMDGFVSVEMPLMRVVISQGAGNPETIGRYILKLDERLIGQLVELLEALQSKGLLAEDLDPQAAAFLLYSQNMTFLLLWTQSDKAPPPEERKQQIEAMVKLVFRSWTTEPEIRRRT